MPRRDAAESRTIQPGDVGIWATCSMKKEGKSVADLRDIFQEVCRMLSIGSAAPQLPRRLIVMMCSMPPNSMGRSSTPVQLRMTTQMRRVAILKLRSRKKLTISESPL
jgi:hypothetical protein